MGDKIEQHEKGVKASIYNILLQVIEEYSKYLRQIKAAHKDVIKKLLKKDKTGYSVVYAFLKGYC